MPHTNTPKHQRVPEGLDLVRARNRLNGLLLEAKDVLQRAELVAYANYLGAAGAEIDRFNIQVLKPFLERAIELSQEAPTIPTPIAGNGGLALDQRQELSPQR